MRTGTDLPIVYYLLNESVDYVVELFLELFFEILQKGLIKLDILFLIHIFLSSESYFLNPKLIKWF